MALQQRGSNKGSHWWRHKYDCISKAHQDYIGEYRIWGSMRARCNRPQAVSYPLYGGRGIKVCDRWNDQDEGFINFYNDMGKCPVDKHGKKYQIDRIDPDGDYEPSNCRWVPAKVNAMNKRNVHKTYLWGDLMSMNDVIKCLNLKRTTVNERARLRGDAVEDAIVAGLKAKYGERVCVL